jgi:uncharacterized protein (TIGR02996 family)
MDLRQSFLEDIVAHPDDAAPRLIFADWLDEHGEAARADFIRLQVRTPKNAAWHALLQEHATRWTAELAGVAKSALFRRGFIEGLVVQTEQMPAFVELLPQLCRLYPLRKLRLQLPSCDELRQVIDAFQSGMLRLNMLEVYCRNETLPDPWMTTLRNESCGESLTSLLIECESAPHEWFDALTLLDGPGFLNGLNELGIGFHSGVWAGEEERPQVIERIVRSEWMDQLLKLHIPFVPLSEASARFLANDPLRDSLTHLDLGCTEIPLAGWQALQRSRTITGLKWLGVFGAQVLTGNAFTPVERLRDHEIGQQLISTMGARADFTTSSTFPPWKGTVEVPALA